MGDSVLLWPQHFDEWIRADLHAIHQGPKQVVHILECHFGHVIFHHTRKMLDGKSGREVGVTRPNAEVLTLGQTGHLQTLQELGIRGLTVHGMKGTA